MSVADINVPVYGFYGSTDARRVEHSGHEGCDDCR